MPQVKFTMTYESGGGTKYDGGDWYVKETKKILQIELFRSPFFSLPFSDKKIRLRKDNRSRHCLRLFDNGAFTVYFYRNGTPSYFEKLCPPAPQQT